MSQDIYPVGVGQPHCYGCLQWDGKRVYDPEHRKIKVDADSFGHCRVNRAPIRASSRCESYFSVR